MGEVLQKQRNSVERLSHFQKGNKIFKRYGDDRTYNSIEVQKTSVNSKTRIVTPENASDFKIVHYEAGETVYIGDADVTQSTGLPLTYGVELLLTNMQKGDNNEIYGIGSQAIDVFAYGKVKS